MRSWGLAFIEIVNGCLFEYNLFQSISFSFGLGVVWWEEKQRWLSYLVYYYWSSFNFYNLVWIFVFIKCMRSRGGFDIIFWYSVYLIKFWIFFQWELLYEFDLLSLKDLDSLMDYRNFMQISPSILCLGFGFFN